MKKIPTIFERDWDGDRSRVLNKPHPDCAWVFAGEGVATRKLDGTSCMVRDGKLFKRREVKSSQQVSGYFEIADVDLETGKTVGWVPVGDGPEDRWHREAFSGPDAIPAWSDGTYELIGPKVQGNPEGASVHRLIPHGWSVDHIGAPGIGEHVPVEYDALRDWLANEDIEGIVWHHPDGRMAKVKKRDFGLPRKPVANAA